MSPLQRLATGALVLLAAGGAGFFVYRMSADRPAVSFEDSINAAAKAASSSSHSSVSASRSTAVAARAERGMEEDAEAEQPPETPDTAAAPARPSPTVAATPAPSRLPALSLPGLDGKPRALSEWRGRPLIINFWATWCEPCRREIPLLKQLRGEHAKDGLEVLGIAIDFRDAVASYVGKAGIDYPVLIAEQDATAPKAFGVGMGLPTTVVANREGRIVATHVGELRADKAASLVELALAAP